MRKRPIATRVLGVTAVTVLMAGLALLAQSRSGLDMRDSTPAFLPPPVAPPPGSPNVVVVLLDDLGYADLGTYGSEIGTPGIDSLAAEGLRYSHFTSTPICSPSRAALLTGLNHHSAGVGWLAGADWGYPGYRGELARDAVTVAEVLQQAGFATFMVGKWHLAASRDAGAAGPFHNWPTGRGFDRYWGFLGGVVSQFFPDDLVDGTEVISPPADGSFYLPDLLTDRAIGMIRDLRAADPGKPFFLYYAAGATHSPHHTLPGDRATYAGIYDGGWDEIREQRLARQKALGLVPGHTELAGYSPGVVPWGDLDSDQRRMYSRLQENYAAFLDRTDQNVVRLVDYLKSIGEYDNTIFVVTSDNGGSRQTGVEGDTNAVGRFYQGETATTGENLQDYEIVGDWQTYPIYPHGWMQASNTPFIQGKRSTFAGGVNVPLIVSWPAGIEARGEVRHQFHHINDVMPTLLEVLQVEHPKTYKGREVRPIEGVSMAYSFRDADAPSRKREQYYELEGQRAFYADGWRIATWRPEGTAWDEAPWQLFDLRTDFSEARDVAEERPAKVAELEARWWAAAGRYNVLPINDRRTAAGGNTNRTTATNSDGTPRSEPVVYRAVEGVYYPSGRAPTLSGRSYTVTARVNRISADEAGVLVAYGSVYAGWTLYIKDNRLVYEHNLPRHYRRITSDRELPLGNLNLTFRFGHAESGGGSGTGTLLVDGNEVGRGDITKHVRSGWERLGIGQDPLTPAGRGYASPFPYTGTLLEVVFE